MCTNMILNTVNVNENSECRFGSLYFSDTSAAERIARSIGAEAAETGNINDNPSQSEAHTST